MSAGADVVTLPHAPAGQSISQRILALQAEARQLAVQHVGMLTDAMAQVAVLAAEIADGGEAYPPGIRELCRRMAEDTPPQRLTLSAIMERIDR